MARRGRVVAVALLLYLVVVGLFVVTVSAVLRGGSDGALAFGPRVAVVELEGVILDVDDLLADLKRHRDNPRVRAVVIRINSPGGVVGPTQELHAALRRIRESGKPVVASIGSVAASGGYYVAVAADRVYANPGSLTGSIGVILQLANLEGLLKKVGVDYTVVKAGQFKDLGNMARAMTPEERRLLQALLDDVHGQFIDAVAEGRRLDRATVVRFADGRILSGAQAAALAMVDRLGGLEEAIKGAAELAGISGPPQLITPRRRFSLADLVRNQLGVGRLSGGIPGLPGLPPFKTPLYLMD